MSADQRDAPWDQPSRELSEAAESDATSHDFHDFSRCPVQKKLAELVPHTTSAYTAVAYTSTSTSGCAQASGRQTPSWSCSLRRAAGPRKSHWMPGSTDDEKAPGDAWHEGAAGDEDDISDGLPNHEEAEDYDPDADDKDQAFIDKQRCNRRSNAHLSCPGCLTTVCVDCQAHTFKDGQFRAMFAINARSVCPAFPYGAIQT